MVIGAESKKVVRKFYKKLGAYHFMLGAEAVDELKRLTEDTRYGYWYAYQYPVRLNPGRMYHIWVQPDGMCGACKRITLLLNQLYDILAPAVARGCVNPDEIAQVECLFRTLYHEVPEGKALPALRLTRSRIKRDIRNGCF